MSRRRQQLRLCSRRRWRAAQLPAKIGLQPSCSVMSTRELLQPLFHRTHEQWSQAEFLSALRIFRAVTIMPPNDPESSAYLHHARRQLMKLAGENADVMECLA